MMHIKISNTLVDNTEDLDIVTPMHNLLVYGNNHSLTSESLWNYYRDEVVGATTETNYADFKKS